MVKIISILLLVAGCEFNNCWGSSTCRKPPKEFKPEVKLLYSFWESPSNQFEYIRVNGMICLRWFGPNNNSGLSCNWNTYITPDLLNQYLKGK